MNSVSSGPDTAHRNYIDGQWLDGGAGAYEVFNPARKAESVGRFPLSTADDVQRAVAAAHRAFPEWSSLAPSDRADVLVAVSDALSRNGERLAAAATAEQGKLYAESRGEVTRGVKEVRIVAGETIRLDGIVRPSDSPRTVNVAERVPIGVVAAITPWNFPILTPLRKIAPALAAGCTVVFKPASSTSLCAA